jgi:glycosyltransferase involved in cell wall biosynthesis
MTADKSTIVHVGPALSARGGIASVLSSYRDSPLADWYDLRFVATAGEGTKIRKLAAGSLGLTRLERILARAGSKALAHVHISSGYSMRRKAVAIDIAYRRGVPVVAHIHSGAFQEYYDRSTPGWRARVRETLSKASEIVVLSPEWADRIAVIVPDRALRVVPNPVLLPEAPHVEDAPMRVTFVGRIGERKGVPELLGAIDRLQRGQSDLSWTIAGDGEVEWLRREVRELPEPERVDVTGWLERSEVQEILARTSVCVLPSHHEGKPVALLEAMSYGCSCVATPVGGVPDLIEDGVTGVLVPVGDPGALAEGILRVTEDPVLRRAIGVNARKLIEEDYEIKRVAEELADLYERLGFPPVGREHA